MKKYVLIIILCFFYIYTFCQIPTIFSDSCGISDPTYSQSSKSTYECDPLTGDERTFDAPFEPSSNFPNYIIRVNFIFMQRDDGTGNFQQNDPEHQSLIDAFITEMNSTYASLIDPHSTST